MRRLVVLASVAAQFCAVAPAVADQTERFLVTEDRLVFDTTVPLDGSEVEIRGDDVEQMRDLLRDNPDVGVLELKSTGGGHYSSMDLAALVIDFGLDTHVTDFCESACVTVFLGGENRSMALGGRLGFHQLSWNASAVSDYYDSNKDRRNWATPFDFAEWMYQDTQTETYNRLVYMIARGVNAEFAIQSLRKPDTSMWYPYRAVLLGAGVLTQ